MDRLDWHWAPSLGQMIESVNGPSNSYFIVLLLYPELKKVCPMKGNFIGVSCPYMSTKFDQGVKVLLGWMDQKSICKFLANK